MFPDAELYSGNHKMQTKDANHLLDHVLPEMSFGEDDVVMDIGCGSGGNTKDVFMSRIPKQEKLIAIDILPEMIQHASVHAADEKIEYHVADITDRSSLKKWEGLVSKAFSLHCFQWVKNQKMGFKNIYDLLKPQGEVALLFVHRSTLWSSYPRLVQNNKWNQYLKDADQCIAKSHHLNLAADHFRKLFEDVGFEVQLCLEETRIHPHKTDDELKAVLKTLSCLTSYVPDERREEFIDDLFTEVVKICGRNFQGLPVFAFDIVILHARKP